MRAGGIATFVVVLLLSAGPAAAANPVSVTIAAASSPSGQGCVTVVVKDSVTGSPVSADLVLALSSGSAAGEVPVSTDAAGNGSVCFSPPPVPPVLPNLPAPAF